ncbi:MAG: hypothetical protein JO340_17030 [Acidobacteriaceae bacterium]|nr:hypothetical protein [Acidobacteriaceae bacterium]
MRNSLKQVLAGAAAALLLTLTWSASALRAQEVSEHETESENHDVLKNLKFRNLGPAIAGGRVTAVEGVSSDPNLYYVGAASGGVFKTTDGGATWTPIFQHQATSSIGALALSPANPNHVWVGTGEANIRNDITDGAGLYFSSNGGQSWRLMGLRDAGQISRIVVDPQNPEIVFVGAVGHAWAPNPERGLFRTADGGKTWKKVLFVDDSTGVIDLVMQPGNSQVLFAAMWHVRRYPWMLVDGGESSAIYRSTDGGDTWKKLTEGLPEGPLGRIGLAIAPSNPNHIYSLIGAKKGMLWQSMNAGDTWTAVTDNHALDARPFYFSTLTVAPNDENKVYFLSFDLMESDDGGKTAHVADRGVHPDHHAIWIDPRNPNRIIQGNDGGVFLTLNAGKSWRFLDGLPIEQMYQVAIDSRTPYTVCGGLQDNSAWCGPSSDLGRHGVTNADWYVVVGGDGEYAVPAPSDPNLIYVDSQSGFIERLQTGTHLSHFVRPSLDSVEETPPSQLKYRFNWTSPIAVSESDANEAYIGGNVLFKTTDGGQTWQPISPDLTHNDKSKQEISGEPVEHDISGAESYDTIISITIAPTDGKVIWVGADDGYIQVTRDGGKTWQNVTPNIPGAPAWARVYQIGVSPFDAGTAYAAFDAHQLDDRHAYVYKTTDYGRSWKKIGAGLPDSPVFVVREDPNQRGLLVLGNDQGLFYSSDAGENWRPLKANFPTAPVWDLKFAKHSRDLVVATHGRGFFVFDDIRPLEQLSAAVEAGNFHLFQGGAATMFNRWEADEDNPVAFSAPNAPSGAPIDYFLKNKLKATEQQKQEHQTPVKIVITDQQGHAVSTQYGPSNAGINRFVWDLHYSGVRRLASDIPVEPPPPGELEEAQTRFITRGPRVVPGEYAVAVTVDGHTEKTSVTVDPDPNLHIDEADFRAQTEAALTARNEFRALNRMIERIDAMQRQLADFWRTLESEPDVKDRYIVLLRQGKDLDNKLKALKATVYNPDMQHQVGEDDIHFLADFHSQLGRLAQMLAFAYDQPPNALINARMQELHKQLDEHLAALNNLLRDDVGAYNKSASASGAPTLFAAPVTVTSTGDEQ